jgi:sugar diacid utilization regulator
VLEIATSLLRLAALERRAELRAEQSRRSTLLAAWLTGAIDPEFLLPRLAEAGMEADGRVVFAVAEPGRRSHERQRHKRRSLLEAMRQVGDELLSATGIAFLSDIRSDGCVWAYQAPSSEAQLTQLHAALEAAAGEPVRVGASQAQPARGDGGAMYFQAALALQGIAGESGRAVFSELDPFSWVLQQQPAASLRALRDRLLGELADADKDGKLSRTLRSYLRSPQDMAALADELHVHPNTLRYRLKRIEQLTGRSLGRPDAVAELYLAERIDRMLERGLFRSEDADV